MPNVNGKKFPYTAKGMEDAKKAASKNAKKDAVKMVTNKKSKSYGY